MFMMRTASSKDAHLAFSSSLENKPINAVPASIATEITTDSSPRQHLFMLND
jgi:hypothetical protein